jgi:hypothetical protein
MRRARKRVLNRSAYARPRRREVSADFPTTCISPTNSMMQRLAQTDGPARSAYPIPTLLYKEALANEPIKDENDVQARSPTRSYTQSQCSNRSASPKKITSLWNIGNGMTYIHIWRIRPLRNGSSLAKMGFRSRRSWKMLATVLWYLWDSNNGWQRRTWAG